MPWSLVAAVLVAVVLAGLIGHAAWRRRRSLATVRRAWGSVGPIQKLDDDRAAEAWRELRGAGSDDADVDERTWADLDLDTVLASIDRTHTALGRQALYRRMRSGAAWVDPPAQELLTLRFGREPELRDAVGVVLAGAGRSLGYGFWIITRPESIGIRWWYWSFPPLALAMVAALAVIPFEPRALIAAAVILGVNLVVRTATAWQIPGILTPMRQMGTLLRTAARLAGVEGVAPPAIPGDLGRLGPLRWIAGCVSRDPVASGEVIAGIWEYLNLAFILDANALLFSSRYLRRHGPALVRVALWVGDTDAAWSVASLRAEPRAWSVPVWADAQRTAVAGMWHPLVHSPVPNDIDLEAGTGAIITGANMSGKSTYLRTVGIAAVLARSINTCPAAEWSGRSFRVRSLIGRADDLSAGKSYYQVEADGVVGLLNEATEERPTLFLLDELLRGTNSVERLAAGEAVLRALLADHAGGSPHVVIVATHDGELVSMLDGLYAPFHFQESIGPEGLIFDHRRREGPASTRTAIALLEATGAPPAVIRQARSRAEQLDATKLIASARSGKL